jgi:hypothetical protein
MYEKQRVADMADEVLARQAVTHAVRTGERFEKLRSGPRRAEERQRSRGREG